MHARRYLTFKACARAASQFNMVPQTRKQRNAAAFREDLEKERIRNRREGFAHYEVRVPRELHRI